jgi:hypothetical protein
VAKQYGAPSQSRSDHVLPSPEVQRELRESIAGQYGGAR